MHKKMLVFVSVIIESLSVEKRMKISLFGKFLLKVNIARWCMPTIGCSQSVSSKWSHLQRLIHRLVSLEPTDCTTPRSDGMDCPIRARWCRVERSVGELCRGTFTYLGPQRQS